MLHGGYHRLSKKAEQGGRHSMGSVYYQFLSFLLLLGHIWSHGEGVRSHDSASSPTFTHRTSLRPAPGEST